MELTGESLWPLCITTPSTDPILWFYVSWDAVIISGHIGIADLFKSSETNLSPHGWPCEAEEHFLYPGINTLKFKFWVDIIRIWVQFDLKNGRAWKLLCKLLCLYTEAGKKIKVGVKLRRLIRERRWDVTIFFVFLFLSIFLWRCISKNAFLPQIALPSCDSNSLHLLSIIPQSSCHLLCLFSPIFPLCIWLVSFPSHHPSVPLTVCFLTSYTSSLLFPVFTSMIAKKKKRNCITFKKYPHIISTGLLNKLSKL